MNEITIPLIAIGFYLFGVIAGWIGHKTISEYRRDKEREEKQRNEDIQDSDR